MRKVFSSNDVSETMLVQDALARHDIEVSVQNEHSGRTAVPAFRPPAEIWVVDDNDYNNARRIVTDTLSIMDSKNEGTPWVCPSCGEENPRSFELCWSCGHEKENGGDHD